MCASQEKIPVDLQVIPPTPNSQESHPPWRFVCSVLRCAPTSQDRYGWTFKVAPVQCTMPPVPIRVQPPEIRVGDPQSFFFFPFPFTRSCPSIFLLLDLLDPGPPDCWLPLKGRFGWLLRNTRGLVRSRRPIVPSPAVLHLPYPLQRLPPVDAAISLFLPRPFSINQLFYPNPLSILSFPSQPTQQLACLVLSRPAGKESLSTFNNV